MKVRRETKVRRTAASNQPVQRVRSLEFDSAWRPLNWDSWAAAFNPIHRCHLSDSLSPPNGSFGSTKSLLYPDRSSLLINNQARPRRSPTPLPNGRPGHSECRALAISEMWKSAGQANPTPSTPFVWLQQEYGAQTQLFFLIGLDAFLRFSILAGPLTLLELCRFVVFSRPGLSFRSLSQSRSFADSLSLSWRT